MHDDKCSPRPGPFTNLQKDLNARTRERSNRGTELSTFWSGSSLGVAPAVPTIVLATEKNPSIAVFRRYRVLNQEFMLSFTEDTFERKRNARETGTTTDTKEVEKASRYDEGRRVLHDGQLPKTGQKVRSLHSN